MQITNPQIASEIAKKLDIIKRSPYGPFANGNCHKLCINHEAMSHSLRIEEPYASPRKPHIGRAQTKLLNNMLSAFYWGKGEIHEEKISERFIKEIAGRIDPKQHNGLANYREVTEGVRPKNASWTPVYPEKISGEMSKFVHALNQDISWGNIQSVLDGASYAHLHLVRIHPFSDTNGRTSRMLQNLILDKAGMPSPAIYEGERFHYFQLLDDAINGWRARTGDSLAFPSKEERAFYTFMAGKVSATLDRVLEHH